MVSPLSRRVVKREHAESLVAAQPPIEIMRSEVRYRDFRREIVRRAAHRWQDTKEPPMKMIIFYALGSEKLEPGGPDAVLDDVFIQVLVIHWLEHSMFIEIALPSGPFASRSLEELVGYRAHHQRESCASWLAQSSEQKH